MPTNYTQNSQNKKALPRGRTERFSTEKEIDKQPEIRHVACATIV